MLKLTITNELIKRGNRNESYSCPVALAFREMGYTDVEVGRYALMLNGKEYPWGDVMVKKITEYDESGRMEPFILEIETETS